MDETSIRVFDNPDFGRVRASRTADVAETMLMVALMAAALFLAAV